MAQLVGAYFVARGFGAIPDVGVTPTREGLGVNGDATGPVVEDAAREPQAEPSDGRARLRRGLFAVGVLVVVLAAALGGWALLGRDQSAGGRDPVSASEVGGMDAAVRAAARRNTELEEALQSPANQPDGSAFFTQDVVWEDWGVRFVGLDAVMGFLRIWAMTSGGGSFADTGAYAGRFGGASTEDVWGMSGWTREEPGRWLAEWVIRDGKVAVVRLLGDLGVMRPDRLSPGVKAPSPATVQSIRELTGAYATAWSSGDPTAVGSLYADDAVREDTVFGDTETGRGEIEAFASRFDGWYPGARFTIVRPYSVGKPAVPGRPVTAAELVIGVPRADGTSCAVKAAVVLETRAGLIDRERVYYDADSLVACGWAA